MKTILSSHPHPLPSHSGPGLGEAASPQHPGSRPGWAGGPGAPAEAISGGAQLCFARPKLKQRASGPSSRGTARMDQNPGRAVHVGSFHMFQLHVAPTEGTPLPVSLSVSLCLCISVSVCVSLCLSLSLCVSPHTHF